MEISQFAGQFAAKRALIKNRYAAEASAVDNCGSELAREGVDAGDRSVKFAGQFAGKRAPTNREQPQIKR